MINSDFILKEVDGQLTVDGKTHYYKATRLVHKETGGQYGEYFQEAIRTPEHKAASIVYQKYKRKFELEHKNFIKLLDTICKISAEREESGKKTSFDYLVQIASNEIKKQYETTRV